MADITNDHNENKEGSHQKAPVSSCDILVYQDFILWSLDYDIHSI